MDGFPNIYANGNGNGNHSDTTPIFRDVSVGMKVSEEVQNQPLHFHQPPPVHQPLQPLQFPCKRGSEELYSHPGMVANGTIMSPTQTNMDVNDAKKVKLDQVQPPPSKVLHIRNVHADATEHDLLALSIHHGKPTNFVLLKKKAQALLEMEDVISARKFRDHYNRNPVSMYGKQLHIQFSNHTELKTEDSQQNEVVRALLEICGEVMEKEENRKCVLRVIIENVLYPVTVNTLHTIFKKFGHVQKVITFTKNNTLQALIQMSNPISVVAAKRALHQQHIYPDSCLLRIDYSKLTSLNVKYNNDKSRDFTNNSLPIGEGITDRGYAPFASPQNVMTSPFAMPSYGTTPLTSYGATTAGGMPLYQSPTTNAGEDQVAQSRQNHAILGNYSYHQALIDAQMAAYPDTRLYHGRSWGEGMGMLNGRGHQAQSLLQSPAGLASLQAAQAAAAFPQMGMPTMGAPGLPHMQHPCPQSPVLLVTNLNEQRVTPDALFTLFGVYGDVQRVKIIYSKKDSALIQFADIAQAHMALSHLNNVQLYGKQVKVTPSKYSVVQMPKEGSQDAGAALTKEYINSPLHRFKKPNSKNHQNIYPPSATLHLSNIPPLITEDQLKDAFTRTGGEVVNFKFFAKDRKMALIQMGDVEQAVHALIAMHNYKLSDSNHLRVSFSKSTIPTN
ncbi:polypyrimidine tract-binding protein 3-like isoform X7 [Lineus longissimus]|uniref:polypyrimidine tract-binding protein 3-like isoform X7 n=1 Tax=Lineus longissimus TaxID=88925 RepID=UPI00315D5DD8